MKTLQSANSGEALVIKNNSKHLYNHKKNELREISESAAREWINSHGELKEVTVRNTKELQTTLGHFISCNLALRYSLISADPDISSALRLKAAEFLNPILEDKNVYKWLVDLYCIQYLEKESIRVIDETSKKQEIKKLKKYNDFFNTISTNQEKIKAVSKKWSEIEKSSFLGKSHREILNKALGSSFFEKIVTKTTDIESSELALLTIIKSRPHLNSEIESKIKSLEIDCFKSAKAIGLKDTILGIEHFNLWEKTLTPESIRKNTKIHIWLTGKKKKEQLPLPKFPKEISEKNLRIKIESTNEISHIPARLYHHIESNLLQKEKNNISIREQQHITPMYEKHINTALKKIEHWASIEEKGISTTYYLDDIIILNRRK